MELGGTGDGTAFSVLYPVFITGYFYIMKLWDAINKMRQLTADGKSFSMLFMSFNSSEYKSEGGGGGEPGEIEEESGRETL